VKRLVTGLEAVAQGAHEHGVHLVIAHALRPVAALAAAVREHPELRLETPPTERIALEVAMGAAFAGARVLAAAPSFAGALDLLEAASYAGLGGLVALVVDDPALAVGHTAADSRALARAAGVPCLEPADPAECSAFVGEALALSERHATPVLLRLTTRLARSVRPVAARPREAAPARGRPASAPPRALSPALSPAHRDARDERLAALAAAGVESALNRAELRSRDLGIVASGAAAWHAREAFPEASLLALGATWPVPTALVRDFAARVKRLVVAEEVEPLLEADLRAAGIRCEGKDVLPRHGELTPAVLRRALGAAPPPVVAEAAPERPAEACPGCPRRAVLHVLKRLHVQATADLGCAAFAAAPPTGALESACARGSIAFAHGVEAALGARVRGKVVALVSDEPLASAAALAHAVAERGAAAVIAVGRAAEAAEPLARAANVRHEVVDALDLAALERALAAALAAREPTLVAARAPCPPVRGGPRAVSAARCNRCGACLRLGCPAISDGLDAMRIDAALCAGCGVCAQVCRAAAIAPIATAEARP
jgi:indolepyruvate ferredoxin oxidoreductase, alpha subunit